MLGCSVRGLPNPPLPQISRVNHHFSGIRTLGQVFSGSERQTASSAHYCVSRVAQRIGPRGHPNGHIHRRLSHFQTACLPSVDSDRGKEREEKARRQLSSSPNGDQQTRVTSCPSLPLQLTPQSLAFFLPFLGPPAREHCPRQIKRGPKTCHDLTRLLHPTTSAPITNQAPCEYSIQAVVVVCRAIYHITYKRKSCCKLDQGTSLGNRATSLAVLLQ